MRRRVSLQNCYTFYNCSKKFQEPGRNPSNKLIKKYQPRTKKQLVFRSTHILEISRFAIAEMALIKYQKGYFDTKMQKGKTKTIKMISKAFSRFSSQNIYRSHVNSEVGVHCRGIRIIAYQLNA